jgi:NAD(P)-dependent dehydrogenase (short-subunit alcohol dehydrogenase family)
VIAALAGRARGRPGRGDQGAQARAVTGATGRQLRDDVLSITTTLVEQADARVPAALAALTKGGVAAATKSLAIEHAAAGIRVNAVSRPTRPRTPAPCR